MRQFLFILDTIDILCLSYSDLCMQNIIYPKSVNDRLWILEIILATQKFE